METISNMKKPETKNILVSVPLPLLKRLDSAARMQKRSRTAEVCVRLAESLKAKKVASAEVAA
nr:hypothetical protein [uncultured Albidiferax sp.]